MLPHLILSLSFFSYSCVQVQARARVVVIVASRTCDVDHGIKLLWCVVACAISQCMLSASVLPVVLNTALEHRSKLRW